MRNGMRYPAPPRLQGGVFHAQRTIYPKAMHLSFPQWQGAGERPALGVAARALPDLAPAYSWVRVPVEWSGELPRENGILGRGVLLRQLQSARSLLRERAPGRVFTLGGDCSVSLAPVAHLNALYQGDLTVVWLDAHADLNTPASSPSATLQGMPLRLLLGEGDAEFLRELSPPLHPLQVTLAGVRDFDPPEDAFVREKRLMHVTADALNAQPRALGNVLSRRGAGKLFVHLDLDVLDPLAFGALGWPVMGGLSLETVEAVLADLHGRFTVVGGALTEFLPLHRSGHATPDEHALAQRVLRAWLGDAESEKR